ncbi:MAG: glucose-6-phosphate isomerase [Pseudomonadota bacterium]
MTLPLSSHAKRLEAMSLATLSSKAVSADTNRLSAAGWTIDLSRHRIDDAALNALLAHGEAAGLQAALDELFSGAIVNPSENRPALHWALRLEEGDSIDEPTRVRATLDAADQFANGVYTGRVAGASGAPFKNILHIGIGGSDFGPRLIADALQSTDSQGPQLRFCANLDPHDLDAAIEGLDPKETLVVGVSKSFGTEETLYNLGRARTWLKAGLGTDWTRHMALVTANPDRARTWLEGGAAHLFDMPLSVGGRFSLWSAASVSVACSLGVEAVSAFRHGAKAMDDHVRVARLDQNLAVRLALLDYWNTNVLGHSQRVVLAYARRLRMLPTYLQQLEMESNGKSVSPSGIPVEGATAPALWGGEGSIGQHSYHQWLHQGTQIVPTEFILALSEGGDRDGKLALAAHALAQAEVLANGRSLEEVLTEEPGIEPHLATQKVHGGDRPSSFFIHGDFGPAALGSIIALYEHRTYLAGVLWGVNTFDQWGVERGKTMAGRLKPALAGEAEADDPVTAALSQTVRRFL